MQLKIFSRTPISAQILSKSPSEILSRLSRMWTEWPRRNEYVICFLLNSYVGACLFLHGTPLSGYFVYAPKKKLDDMGMTESAGEKLHYFSSTASQEVTTARKTVFTVLRVSPTSHIFQPSNLLTKNLQATNCTSNV